MNKTVPRTPLGIFMGWVGCILALGFILGASIYVRCSGISVNYQLLCIVLLIVISVILSSVYIQINGRRWTHHAYWYRNAKYQEDVGPLEQKCGQFTVILVITAIIIYADMWLNWLSKIASKILSI